jgi:hypothetical protein
LSRYGRDFAVQAEGRVVVSKAALDVLRRFSLAQCEIFECE